MNTQMGAFKQWWETTGKTLCLKELETLYPQTPEPIGFLSRFIDGGEWIFDSNLDNIHYVQMCADSEYKLVYDAPSHLEAKFKELEISNSLYVEDLRLAKQVRIDRLQVREARQKEAEFAEYTYLKKKFEG